jgi:hypothetical protein
VRICVISKICKDRFGADIKHTDNGNALVFDKQCFNKVKEAYSLEDSGVSIIKEHKVKDSSSIGAGIEEKVTDGDDGIRTENEEILEETDDIDEEDVENWGEGE